MIPNQYHETQFKRRPASASHCSVDLRIISPAAPCRARSILHPSCPPQSLCAESNELRLSSSCSPKSISISPLFNLRVLIDVGKVICQVCFACGFLRLKATGNSSSVRRAGAVLITPEGGFSSADSRRLQLLIWSYWILIRHSQRSYGPAALDLGNEAQLCRQHPPPLPFQFLLNLSLQMSISFCKGSCQFFQGIQAEGAQDDALRHIS